MRHHFPPVLTLLIIVFTGCSGISTAPISAPSAGSMKFENTVVSLTFDDGDADNYEIRPVLAQNNLRATFYVVTGFIGTQGYMTEAQLRDLYADGHEIGAHSLNHTKLTEVRGADLRREVCQSRLDLLALGFDAVSFAYPYGYFDEQARQTVIDCGYNSARTVIDGPDAIPPADPYTIKAMPYIVKDTRLPKMQRYVTQVNDAGGGWVIFVFHHVCAGCDQYAIDPGTFAEFAGWLGSQQEHGLIIKTIGEVVGGQVKPGVEP